MSTQHSPATTLADLLGQAVRLTITTGAVYEGTYAGVVRGAYLLEAGAVAIRPRVTVSMAHPKYIECAQVVRAEAA